MRRFIRPDLLVDLAVLALGGSVGRSGDLAAAQPDKFQELKTAWDQRNSTLVNPLWGGGAAAKQ